MEGLWVGIVEPYFHHNFLGQLYIFLPVSLASLTESFFFCLPLQKVRAESCPLWFKLLMLQERGSGKSACEVMGHSGTS